MEREHAQRFERISGSFVTARLRYVRQCTVPGLVYSIAAALLIAAVYLVCTLGLKIETDRLVVLVYVFARLWPLFSGFQGRIQAISTASRPMKSSKAPLPGTRLSPSPTPRTRTSRRGARQNLTMCPLPIETLRKARCAA